MGTLRRWWLLLGCAWRTRRVETVVVVIALVVLVLGAHYSESLRPPWWGASVPDAESSRPDDLPTWLNNLQAVLGAFTLLIAVFVWFGELREDWEDELPCRMSVYFFHAGLPAIVCRHVWLAGAADLRAWGQQVGAQAAGERFLDFSPDVQARSPELAMLPDGSACRHHTVRFLLTRRPAALADTDAQARYQNLLAGDTTVRSEPVADVLDLPDVQKWSPGAARIPGPTAADRPEGTA